MNDSKKISCDAQFILADDTLINLANVAEIECEANKIIFTFNNAYCKSYCVPFGFNVEVLFKELVADIVTGKKFIELP